MKLTRIAATALIALPLALLGAVPAFADEAECAGTSFSPDGGSGMEYITPDARFVPQPLRGTSPDCVSHLADRELFDDAYEYSMVWVDVDYDEFVRVVRAFEDAGWGTGLITTADLDGGGAEVFDPGLSADDLAALDELPLQASTRFSDIRTGDHIVSITYYDGTNYSDEFSLDDPYLVDNFIGTQPFSANGIADPGILSNLRTIAEAAPTPAQVAVAGGSAVMLMLIVGWPGNLLGSVVKARYDTVVAWLAERRKATRKEKKSLPPWVIWPGFVLAAIIGGFVDPEYGFNPMSARSLVSGLLSFVIFNFAAWSLTRLIITRVQPDAQPYIKFRWGSLLILLGAVVIARLLQFDPGVIFGLVSGLAFGLVLAKSRDAMVALLGAGFGLAASLIAWVGFSLLAPVAAANPGQLALVFVSEFLAGVTVQGISSLPIALLPFAVLNGGKVFRWRRWAWAVAYAVGLLAFMLVLLTVPKSWGEIGGDFTRWIVLFVAFGVLAVAVWGIDQALASRRSAKTDLSTART